MHAGLNSRHVLQRALEDSQRSAHRRLSRHVAHLQVHGVSRTATFFHDLVHQASQNLRRLLVRQGQQVVSNSATGHVHVTPLTRSDRCVITLDPQATGFKSTRQVTQCASINQLTNKRSAGLSESANEVDKTKTVEAKSRHVAVMDKMLTLGVVLIIWFPVAADSQYLVGALLNSDHVRQRDASDLTVLLVLVAGHVIFDVHLEDLVAVVGSGPKAQLLGNLLLDFVQRVGRLTQLDVTVEASHLKTAHVVLGLAHHVGYPLSRLQVRRAIRHNEVFGWHEQ